MEPLNMGLSGEAQWDFLHLSLSQAGLIYEFKGIWTAGGTAWWQSICLPSISGFHSQQPRIRTCKQTEADQPACQAAGGLPNISSKEPFLFLLLPFFLCAARFCYVAQTDLEPWSSCLSLWSPKVREMLHHTCSPTIVNGRQSIFRENAQKGFFIP